MNIWFGLYLLISVLIALSIIVVCIKYRKKENSLFYVLIVYLSLIILINIGFILFTQEKEFPLFVILTTIPVIIHAKLLPKTLDVAS
jgi:hypothetical protein